MCVRRGHLPIKIKINHAESQFNLMQQKLNINVKCNSLPLLLLDPLMISSGCFSKFALFFLKKIGNCCPNLRTLGLAKRLPRPLFKNFSADAHATHFINTIYIFFLATQKNYQTSTKFIQNIHSPLGWY